eukprot:2411675-Prymnesium_polylepis.1
MAPAGSARIVEHREYTQGARSSVDLRRRSRRSQGLKVGNHVPPILVGAPLVDLHLVLRGLRGCPPPSCRTAGPR